MLRYGRLVPNYDKFWLADSDACINIDPHEVILWFWSRGWGRTETQLFHPSHGCAGWLSDSSETRLTYPHDNLAHRFVCFTPDSTLRASL